MNKRKPPQITSAVNSAALQDHLLRKYCLGNQIPKRSSSLSNHGKTIMKIASQDEITKKQIMYREKLTLAQRLGLVSKPDAPLTHEQWAAVEKTSEMREEYKGNCPICHEHLGRHASVILSCSHVFHTTCMKSFEKFSKTKACPICRKNSYEKKTYKTSTDYYYIFCIVKIQSWVRCFIMHERFIKHMLETPSKNVAVYRKYRTLHMNRLDIRFNKHLDRQEIQIDRLFSDLEAKLQASKAAVSALKNISRSSKGPEIDWAQVCDKAVSRHEKVCPICLQSLEYKKETCILSCSHLFHSKCIESFEYFSINAPACPVCRSSYVKKTIND